MVVIDNSRTVYVSLKLRITGIKVHCRPDVLNHEDGSKILYFLDRDLRQCLQILPASVRPLVRRTNFWVNQTYCYGSMEAPEVVNHTTAHHHEGWLIWARDKPEKALGIEIYSAEAYLRMRNHWNGCGLILHEICHLIHQHVLGLDCISVKAAYKAAEQSGKYDTVLRRDWAGKANGGDTDLSYSMVDHKEFFAEMSVTYWSRGYQELDCAPCDKMEDCSPPITEKNVQAKIAGIHPNLIYRRVGSVTTDGIPAFFRSLFSQPELPHCNKFYPFTCGQLKHYDPETFETIEKFWTEIATWEDPVESTVCYGCWRAPLKNPHLEKDMFESVEPGEQTGLISDTVDL